MPGTIHESKERVRELYEIAMRMDKEECLKEEINERFAEMDGQ
jgi:hypothetical protein